MQSIFVGGLTLLFLAVIGAAAYLALAWRLERGRRRFLQKELEDVLDSAPMTLNSYQALAMRTAKPQNDVDALNHALLGMGSEVGELLTHWKAHLYYGKPLDRAYMLKELGDELWFLQRAAKALGFTLEVVGKTNIHKLQARYPHFYSNEAALARADEVNS